MQKMLEDKMQAIISCFLLSPVPPKLQLNIPQEIADKVTKKEQISPYVFREAQVCQQLHKICVCIITSVPRLAYLEICLATGLRFKILVLAMIQTICHSMN